MPSKPLVWLRGEVKTPPFSPQARVEAGYLLRLLQEGERFSLPESRPMPAIGATPRQVIDAAKRRWNVYLRDAQEE